MLTAALAGCGNDSPTFTLYRNSPVDDHMRVHLATFDANEPGHYNEENCDLARKLFQAQNGVSVRFWCEKGRYTP